MMNMVQFHFWSHNDIKVVKNFNVSKCLYSCNSFIKLLDSGVYRIASFWPSETKHYIVSNEMYLTENFVLLS